MKSDINVIILEMNIIIIAQIPSMSSHELFAVVLSWTTFLWCMIVIIKVTTQFFVFLITVFPGRSLKHVVKLLWPSVQFFKYSERFVSGSVGCDLTCSFMSSWLNDVQIPIVALMWEWFCMPTKNSNKI